MKDAEEEEKALEEGKPASGENVVIPSPFILSHALLSSPLSSHTLLTHHISSHTLSPHTPLAFY
jgi:hypothetical protein